ncbi:MAG: helix-turn-helix transcriptional regulator [Pseudonocardiales bacterium]|nr:helix-turn-helix transcriptional regulator [Pseudonocardiales bacterium]MBV9032460.1 helix-turn-helix transcriptional regulator [Pseudonocardiales bacterium]
MGPIDPEFFDDDDVRAALAARDIGTLYRLLRRVGVSQRQIAHLTGQSQSEVSEILKGRQVLNVRVLERIADGLGIPRARMGVSYGEQGPDTPSAEEVDEEMKRRVLLATTMAAALSQALQGMGELALPAGQVLPSRLGMSHVHAVRAVTDRLRGVARYYGGQADVFGAAVTLYTRWLEVPAPEGVRAPLLAALAELHTEAGWCRYDEGLDGTGYFTRALRLAGQAGDAYGIANAAFVAGGTLVRNEHPNHALKLFQLGQFRLRGFAPGKSTPATVRAEDSRIPTLTAWLNLNSATAYAVMGGSDQATRYLARANDGWEPRDEFERASMDRVTAGIQLDLGRLDTAEQTAASAVRTYGQGHRKDRTTAELILAEVHVRAGDPHGLMLARQAIDGASTLHSVAVRRQRLVPLAVALEARPGSDARELARTARQLATTPM